MGEFCRRPARKVMNCRRMTHSINEKKQSSKARASSSGRSRAPTAVADRSGCASRNLRKYSPYPPWRSAAVDRCRESEQRAAKAIFNPPPAPRPLPPAFFFILFAQSRYKGLLRRLKLLHGSSLVVIDQALTLLADVGVRVAQCHFIKGMLSLK